MVKRRAENLQQLKEITDKGTNNVVSLDLDDIPENEETMDDNKVGESNAKVNLESQSQTSQQRRKTISNWGNTKTTEWPGAKQTEENNESALRDEKNMDSAIIEVRDDIEDHKSDEMSVDVHEEIPFFANVNKSTDRDLFDDEILDDDMT